MIDLKKRSATLNEKTLTVEVDIINQSFLNRLLKRSGSVKISIRQPPLGVLEEIGAIVAEIPANSEITETLPMLFDRMRIDANAQVDVLACLFECKAYPSETTKKLIRDNIRPVEALNLIGQLFEFADLQSFLNTTILMKGMGLLKSKEIIALPQNKKEIDKQKIFGELLMEHVPDTVGD